MVVPLLIGAAVATFAPGTSKFFGSFTEELFNGALTILAVFYVCMGTTIELKATPYILKKGGALFITAWWSGQLGSPRATNLCRLPHPRQRTSTAFDIAGTGKADERTLLVALQLATE